MNTVMMITGIVLILGSLAWMASTPNSPMRAGLSYASLPFVLLFHAFLWLLYGLVAGALLAADIAVHLARHFGIKGGALLAPFRIAVTMGVLLTLAAYGLHVQHARGADLGYATPPAYERMAPPPPPWVWYPAPRPRIFPANLLRASAAHLLSAASPI